MTTESSRVFVVGKYPSGETVVYRDQEPVFCYICNTEQEAVRLATDTIEDYKLRFLHQKARVTAEPLGDIPAAHVISDRKAYKVEEVV